MILAWVLCAAPLFTQGRDPLELRTRTALLPASACTSCHTDEGRAWERSAHHRAATNKRYIVAVDANHSPWCKNCHEPVGKTEGITCSVCHVRDNVILSARAPSKTAQSVHAIRREPMLASSDFCAGCHEFHFPTKMKVPVAAHVEDSPELVQSIVSEWRASGSEKTCQACHLDGHRFSTGRRKDTVTVTARRCADATIAVRVAVHGVAHAYPSGDPFRRAIFEVCADAGCVRVLGRYELGRKDAPLGERFTFVADTRVQPCASEVCEEEVVFTLGAEATHWRLRYLYADPHNESSLSLEERESAIASGAITLGCD